MIKPVERQLPAAYTAAMQTILNLASRGLAFIAALALGISAGASLAEQTLLVPFWQSLSPIEFLEWYQNNKARLVAFYSPLQIWSAVLALVACVVSFVAGAPGKQKMLLLAATLFAILVLATFFAFFKDANAALAAGVMEPAELREALEVWGGWQWGRIVLGTIAFGCAVAGQVGANKEE